jgi:cytosine/adenosine deaminase-related metal-dependent hydrolase
MARELLLRGGYVVTVDNSIGDLPEGDVLIRDDQIAAVGRNLSTSTQDALQALDAGITAVADWTHNLQSSEHADADLKGLQESGIRGYFLYGGPGPTTEAPNPPHPRDARRMRDEHFSAGVNGRLRMGMALRGPCFTSAERNAEDFAFARELGLPISTPVGVPGTSDAIITLERFGQRQGLFMKPPPYSQPISKL